MTLSWGRKYLVCPPSHFGVLYEINPWMHREVTVEAERARGQWDTLEKTLREAGAQTEILDPVPDLPDLVFTANAGLVDKDRFLVSTFKHPERQREVPYDIEWFKEHNFKVDSLPEEFTHEGAGDALPFRGVLVSGYRMRSDAGAHKPLSEFFEIPVRVVELVDQRFYHLDLTLCPLDDRRAIIYPPAWDSYGQKMMAELVPEPLILEEEEALTFCANSVVIDSTIVMPSCPPRVGRILEGWGFDVAVCPVDEFLKAGGGCRCLTLALDVDMQKV